MTAADPSHSVTRQGGPPGAAPPHRRADRGQGRPVTAAESGPVGPPSRRRRPRTLQLRKIDGQRVQSAGSHDTKGQSPQKDCFALLLNIVNFLQS